MQYRVCSESLNRDGIHANQNEVGSEESDLSVKYGIGT